MPRRPLVCFLCYFVLAAGRTHTFSRNLTWEFIGGTLDSPITEGGFGLSVLGEEVVVFRTCLLVVLSELERTAACLCDALVVACFFCFCFYFALFFSFRLRAITPLSFGVRNNRQHQNLEDGVAVR